jgi:hypothetical protein
MSWIDVAALGVALALVVYAHERLKEANRTIENARNWRTDAIHRTEQAARAMHYANQSLEQARSIREEWVDD